MDSNEAGKSSFFDAISWCLIGQYPGMVSADSVVRRGCDKAAVSVKFKNGPTISRIRRKGGTEIEIHDESGSLHGCRNR